MRGRRASRGHAMRVWGIFLAGVGEYARLEARAHRALAPSGAGQRAQWEMR